MAQPIELLSDLEPARWLVEGIKGFAVNVGSLVPAVFDSYCRIFHPAEWQRFEPATGASERRIVRWADIAAANGKTVHPLMQFDNLTGIRSRDGGRRQVQAGPDADLWNTEPEVGSLPREIVESLVTILGRHTATPESVYFAIWEGWGGVGASLPEDHEPKLKLPSRRYLLCRGPIERIFDILEDDWLEIASLWWPEDRAWCVATEIDFDSTYLGGGSECVAEVAAEASLEALRVDAGDPLTDTINPGPVDPPVQPRGHEPRSFADRLRRRRARRASLRDLKKRDERGEVTGAALMVHPGPRGSKTIDLGHGWSSEDRPGMSYSVSWSDASGEVTARRSLMKVAPTEDGIFLIGDQGPHALTLGRCADKKELLRRVEGWKIRAPQPDSLTWLKERLSGLST